MRLPSAGFEVQLEDLAIPQNWRNLTKDAMTKRLQKSVISTLLHLTLTRNGKTSSQHCWKKSRFQHFMKASWEIFAQWRIFREVSSSYNRYYIAVSTLWIVIIKDAKKAFANLGLQRQDRESTRFVCDERRWKTLDARQSRHFPIPRILFAIINGPFPFRLVLNTGLEGDLNTLTEKRYSLGILNKVKCYSMLVQK